MKPRAKRGTRTEAEETLRSLCNHWFQVGINCQAYRDLDRLDLSEKEKNSIEKLDFISTTFCAHVLKAILVFAQVFCVIEVTDCKVTGTIGDLTSLATWVTLYYMY